MPYDRFVVLWLRTSDQKMEATISLLNAMTQFSVEYDITASAAKLEARSKPLATNALPCCIEKCQRIASRKRERLPPDI